jgi:hypothetical protein
MPSTQSKIVLTITRMHLLEFPHELSSQNHIVVELVPQARSCELRARKARKGVKVLAVYNDANIVKDKGPAYAGNKCAESEHCHILGSVGMSENIRYGGYGHT